MKNPIVFAILLSGLFAGCMTVSTGERGFTPPPDAGQVETEKLGDGILAALRERDFAKLVENLPANFADKLKEKDFLSSLGRLEKRYGKIGGAEYLTSLDTPALCNLIWKVDFTARGAKGNEIRRQLLFRVVSIRNDDRSEIVDFGFL